MKINVVIKNICVGENDAKARVVLEYSPYTSNN